MAAKPPKPPGNFLKSLLNHCNKNQQEQQHHNNEDDETEGNSNSSISERLLTSNTDNNNSTPPIAVATAIKKSNCNCSNISIMHLFHEMKQEFPTIPDTIVAQCVNENCHQRENCIQMLRNELELNPIPAQSYPAKVLHPPYTTQNTSNNNNITTQQRPPLQQKPVIVQQKPPLKPIRPIRAAPLRPPLAPHPLQNNYNYNNSNNNNNNNNNNIKINSTASRKLINKHLVSGGGVGGGVEGIVDGNGVAVAVGPASGELNPPSQYKQTTTTTTNEVNNNNNNDNICDGGGGFGEESAGERNLPRQRPTTLNLNTQQQKQQQQQRQRLNIQLQQHFQDQRNRQQQQQNHTLKTRPLRKAPLPPIAPKPSHFQHNSSIANNNNNNPHNTNTNSFINDSLSSNHTSPLSESEISVSVSLSTPSPTSSSTPNTTHHHQQQQQQKHNTETAHQHLQTKSPIRHRSVITLQPEPPYTRDFLFTPSSSTSPSSPSLAAATTAATTTIQTPTIQTTSSSSATSSPTASACGSQKSFTSVNLTLRPPVSPTAGSNSALQPSTIDITAGPGFSGASGGGKSLHYSSTSYDARLGYQQNFQITVTDEGGVFSASRIRPQQQQQQKQRSLNQVNICENQYDGNAGNETIKTNNNNYVNSLYDEQQQQSLQQYQQQQQKLQQQQLYLLQQQQFHNNNVVALQQNIQNSIIQSPQGIKVTTTDCGSGVGGVTIGNKSGNMCLQPQQAMDGFTAEILQRQKKRRDKLAAALRENKKRLSQVKQEINLLTEPVPPGLSERLDEKIRKLRTECQAMLRNSSSFTQAPSPPPQELSINHQPQQPHQQQQQPQPFPRQRITTRPPAPQHQTSLDFIQHHSQSSTPHHTPPTASLPNLSFYTSQQQQQQNPHINSPLYFHQQSAPLTANSHDLYNDHDPVINENDDIINNDNNSIVEDDEDDDDDDEYEVVEPWACNMCTFRNHPQLNICEACDNVRILPGTLTNLSRVLTNSTTNCTTNTAAGVNPAAADTNVNTSNNGSRTGLNTANGNLEHDTNLAQQQLQHFALHT